MRREKRRAEQEEKYRADRDRLREKRKRKLLNPSMGVSSLHPLGDGRTVAAGAFELRPAATFFDASGK